MKKTLLFLPVLIFISSMGCKNENKVETNTPNIPLKPKKSTFSEVKNLSDFPKTIFVPTLENKISEDKNSVYCVTFLYAWEEIKKLVGEPIEIPTQFYDLTLLNNSKSFIQVLNPNEYKTSIEVEGDFIKARAEFNKSLSFDTKLNEYKNKLIFKGEKVASFGVMGYDEKELKKVVKIVYYKDNDNFIIKLFPKDKENEIILFKTEKKFNSLSEMNNEINRLNTEKNETFNETDEVIIPKITFTIQTHYTSIEGNTFQAKKQKYRILEAYQRTAFALDEKGAEVESEAEIVADSLFASSEKVTPQPKKMIFDKPFFILLKKKKAENPYFALWVANTELMIKEE